MEKAVPQAPERDRAAELAAWRAARAGTFDGWLDAHHQDIVKLEGFRGMTWPHGDVGLVVRMATQEGKAAVMEVLRRVEAHEGIRIDWDRVELHLDARDIPLHPHVLPAANDASQ